MVHILVRVSLGTCAKWVVRGKDEWWATHTHIFFLSHVMEYSTEIKEMKSTHIDTGKSQKLMFNEKSKLEKIPCCKEFKYIKL